MKIIMVTTMTTAPTLLTGEVTRDGGRLGGLDGGRDPADGVPAIFLIKLDIMDQAAEKSFFKMEACSVSTTNQNVL